MLGICFAIVLYPIYEWLNKKHFPQWLSASVTLLLFIIVLCGPLLGIGAVVFNQSENVYHQVVSDGSAKPFMDRVDVAVNKILPEGIVFNINDKATEFISYVSNNIANIFSTTISAFFSFLLMLLIIFYFLKEGDEWRKTLVVLSPLGDEDREKIISKLTLAIDAVIKGYLLIALAEGIFVGIGLWFFHIPDGALWGVVAGVCSLVPPIGAAFVSVPAIVFLFATGQTASAIGLFVWAIVILAILDSSFRPFVVSKKINIPPILILFSLLGGMALLGPVGILVGPLTLSLLHTLIAIYKNEFIN